ncbi:MAG TPA: TRAM domain-containing protein [Streptosporangiaceae bacterium]|nr:TRAM domain-containing protein [Streptosporangiaceae bacterium]
MRECEPAEHKASHNVGSRISRARQLAANGPGGVTGEEECLVGYQEGQVVELTLGDAVHGGWCVARPDGQPVVFVRHGLPGERVRAQVTDVTSKFARADAVEVLAAAPDRVTPPCPHARPGGCGGCDWQHASLPAQRRLKAAVVAQQLRRLAGVDIEVSCEALDGPGGSDGSDGRGGSDGRSGSGDGGLGWRTRVQFAVRADGVAGLRAHRSHQVIDVGDCLIAHPAIGALGLTRFRWPSSAVDAVEAIVAPSSGERAVIVSGTPGDGTVAALASDAVLTRPRRRGAGPGGQPGVTGLRGRPYLTQRAADRDWRVSAGGFWQVHPAAADVLSAAVLEALEPRTGDTVLDLYCGAGLFGGVLAGAAAGIAVVGVESDVAAVRDARHNLPAGARVHRGDVAAVLRRGGLPSARLVVADPPRTGLAREVIDYVSDPAHGAARFAYVSCDPATLGRDVGLLTGHGWSLAGLRAFDAFPMTHHVECVATLVRDL